ncbi:uncharacterized protein [Montipora foliosa]|uniref:uncharacterized protein n=1 Tax=Montipora foliosa TaxID=591990 RepID=UPI0035F14922
MSLTPKIVEISEFILRNDVDLACITEPWLKDRIADGVIHIPGFSIIRRDREVVEHGGVCLYMKEGYSKYHVIDRLKCCEEHKILWVHLRPRRLPRGYSCLIIAIVFHSDPSAENDNNITNHLSSSLTLIESIYPDCALVVCGDFNHLNLQLIKNHYHLKQIVKVPTRKNAVLDLILMNLAGHYANPEAFPPFGLSDHNTVLAAPMIREGRIKCPQLVLQH